jgi:hypothetical protein
LFLIGLQVMMPVLGVRIDITLPYQPYAGVLLGLLSLVLAYYIFKSN